MNRSQARCAALLMTAAATLSAQARVIPITSTSPEAITHFRRGVELQGNVRAAEANKAFAEALKLDPGFVQARAYLGMTTAGADGLREIERASADASRLPEAERLLVTAILQNRRNERAQTQATLQRLTDSAPDDWRPWQMLGQLLRANGDNAGSARAFRRVTELNPQFGGGFNLLGYAALVDGDVNAAIDAFRRYRTLSPKEANAVDSLAEALLYAGRFGEAEKTFREATTLDPSFYAAWGGIGVTRFYAGDYPGARDAFARAAELAPRLQERLQMHQQLALVALAARRTDDALQTLDAAEKLAGLQALDRAGLTLQRARLLVEAGRQKEALPVLAKARQMADAEGIPAAARRNIRRNAQLAEAVAEFALRDDGLQKTAAALEAEAAARRDDVPLQTAAAMARGLVAAGQRNAAAVKAAFASCSQSDLYCRFLGVQAAERAGDLEAAAAARKALLAGYPRDGLGVLIRSRLTSKT